MCVYKGEGEGGESACVCVFACVCVKVLFVHVLSVFTLCYHLLVICVLFPVSRCSLPYSVALYTFACFASISVFSSVLAFISPTTPAYSHTQNTVSPTNQGQLSGVVVWSEHSSKKILIVFMGPSGVGHFWGS